MHNAAVPPRDGLPLLAVEQHLYLAEPVRVDAILKSVPHALHPANRVDTSVVFVNQGIPECFSGFHLVIPRHVMESEQVFFWTFFQAVKRFSDGGKVLAYRVASRSCTVKANAH